MATGPQRARLDRALSGADDGDIDRHANEWEYCRGILQQIGTALVTASPEVKERIGGRTGPAVDAAFTRSARTMGDKGAELASGSAALRAAADAIRTARTEQADLQRHPVTEPPAYQKPVGQPTRDDLRAEAQNRQAHRDYQAAYADQESRAKAQADAMDRVFGHSADTMKKIHGEPDPKPGGASGGGVGGGSGGSGGSVPSGGGGGPRRTDPGGGGNGAPQGGGPVASVGTPATGGTPGGVLGTGGSTAGGSISAGTGLGLAGAVAGGAAGGLLGTGMSAGGIRGGGPTPFVMSSGTAAGGPRGIGATSRTGVAGALGRPGGVGAVSSGAGGRSGSASAAGRRGTTGGSRGAAGGRGTGSVASGRGGRDKDEKRRKRDVFDTGDDWVEDEDVAPGVLD